MFSSSLFSPTASWHTPGPERVGNPPNHDMAEIAHDSSLEKTNRISRHVSPKTCYAPRQQGDLGLCHFTFSLCMAMVSTAVRCLNGDGPT